MHGLTKTSREPGAMELVGVETPEPASNEALTEADYAGFCGSDAGIYKFRSAPEWMEMSTIISHEYIGRVVERGKEVSRFSVGEHVVERSIRGCGERFQCRIGEESICQGAALTGIGLDGAYAGYIAAPESALQSVPSNAEPKHAAPVELTAICTCAVIQNSRVRTGDRVLVAGLGPIRLFCAQVAVSQGVEVVVTGVGRDTNYRLPLAEELDYPAVNTKEDDLSVTQRELTGDVGLDAVSGTTGHPSGLPVVVEQVRKDGQIVLVGQTGETAMELTLLVRAEVDLQRTYSAMFEDSEWTFQLIGLGDVDHATFLGNRYRLTESEDAFEVFLTGETCKLVFDASVLRE